MNKAFHLHRLCAFADSYYGKLSDLGKIRMLETTSEYLHSTQKAFKTESRRMASLRKEEDNRIGAGCYLTEQDIQLYRNKSLDILHHVVSDFRGLRRKKSHVAILDKFLSTKGLLNKWFINFMSGLMSHGVGPATPSLQIVGSSG